VARGKELREQQKIKVTEGQGNIAAGGLPSYNRHMKKKRSGGVEKGVLGERGGRLPGQTIEKKRGLGSNNSNGRGGGQEELCDSTRVSEKVGGKKKRRTGQEKTEGTGEGHLLKGRVWETKVWMGLRFFKLSTGKEIDS